jgi:hypothetical protein
MITETDASFAGNRNRDGVVMARGLAIREMALDVESVLDDGENEQEALSRSGRFETLRLA